MISRNVQKIHILILLQYNKLFLKKKKKREKSIYNISCQINPITLFQHPHLTQIQLNRNNLPKVCTILFLPLLFRTNECCMLHFFQGNGYRKLLIGDVPHLFSPIRPPPSLEQRSMTPFFPPSSLPPLDEGASREMGEEERERERDTLFNREVKLL